MAVCGMRCIDLNNDMLKIFGIHFSSNKKLKQEKKNMDNEKPYTRRGNRYL